MCNYYTIKITNTAGCFPVCLKGQMPVPYDRQGKLPIIALLCDYDDVFRVTSKGLEFIGMKTNTIDTDKSQLLDVYKRQSIDRPMGIPNSMEEGEADGLYLPYNYIADMPVSYTHLEYHYYPNS